MRQDSETEEKAAEGELTLWQRLLAQRKRAALLILAVGALLLVPKIVAVFPRDTSFELHLKAPSERIEMRFYREGLLERGLTLRPAAGDSVLKETLSLPPGNYRLEVEARRDGDVPRIVKTLDIPQEAPFQIEL